jgi:hypothetical protein
VEFDANQAGDLQVSLVVKRPDGRARRSDRSLKSGQIFLKLLPRLAGIYFCLAMIRSLILS